MQEHAPNIVSLVPRTDRILAALPPAEMELLEPRLEAVQLPFRRNIYEADRPVDHVYFLHRGVASMVTDMPGGLSVEIATVGPEGMVGIPILPGAERMASKAFMQVPGDGVRMEADAFRDAIGRCRR